MAFNQAQNLYRYCYGGGLALGVATRRGLTDAVVSCHPGPVDIASIREASVPLAILCSERTFPSQIGSIYTYI